MRLDKYLAHATGLSRSRAHGLIRSGQVTVNGEVVKVVGYPLPRGAEVVCRDQVIVPQGKLYLMLNKPLGVVCATTDAGHKTVIDLIVMGNKKGLHPAGRLDIDTTGLVLITDDGEWSHRVTSPRHGCNKTYLATLAEPIDETAVDKFAEGIELRNEKRKTLPAVLEIIDPKTVRLTISEGKYHQVKRMFAAVGNRVLTLHRESIGDVSLDETLQPGEWRELSKEEVVLLQR